MADDAQTTVGEHAPNDWTITPAHPPGELEGKAPKLWAFLKSAPVSGAASRYEKFDQEAVAAQSTFKQAARRANRAVLAVACLGAVTASVGALDGVLGGQGPKVILACGVLSILVGGLATMWLFKIQEGNLLDAWMTNRAQAETARIAYFDRVTTPAGDVELASLQLEYFRRYQLQVQVAYYGGRGKQHHAAAARTLDTRAKAVLFGTAANSLAGLLGSKNVAFASLGALGVISSAIGAFATSAGATNQDGRNAERYKRTAETLQSIAERLDEVRKGIAGGTLDILPAFAKAVNDEVSLEHRQWLSEKDRYAGAIQDLEKKLEALKNSEKKDKTPT